MLDIVDAGCNHEVYSLNVIVQIAVDVTFRLQLT